MLPFGLSKFETVFFLVFEQLVEFMGGTRIHDDGVLLPVPPQAPCIEVGRPDRTELTVDRDDFRMMEPRLVVREWLRVK